MWPGSHSVEGSSSSTDSDQHILYTYIHAERCDSEPEEIHSDTDSRAPVGVRPRRRLGYRGREDVVRVAAAGARWSRGNGPGRAGTSAQSLVRAVLPGHSAASRDDAGRGRRYEAVRPAGAALPAREPLRLRGTGATIYIHIYIYVIFG